VPDKGTQIHRDETMWDLLTADFMDGAVIHLDCGLDYVVGVGFVETKLKRLYPWSLVKHRLRRAWKVREV
jgi:hypothetical protein